MVDSKAKKAGASKMKLPLVAVGIFLFGASFSSMFGFVLESTNTTEFCVSCHSMQWSYKEFKPRQKNSWAVSGTGNAPSA